MIAVRRRCVSVGVCSRPGHGKSVHGTSSVAASYSIPDVPPFASSHRDVYLAHASEDKKQIVRPLAAALKRERVSVWIDEAEIMAGDSLRRKIDEGIRDSLRGVAVISPAFVAKPWTKDELDGFFAREAAPSGDPFIIVVVHGISHEELIEFSPMLAGRRYLDTSSGIAHVAKEIRRVIERDRLKEYGRPTVT